MSEPGSLSGFVGSQGGPDEGKQAGPQESCCMCSCIFSGERGEL